MRRVLLFAAVLSVAGALAAGVATQARAGGNGAGVVRDDGLCFVGNTTGSWYFSCTIQIVFGPTGSITQYIDGSVISEGSSPLPSTAVTDFTGWPCLVLGGQVLTTAKAGVLTPSGQVHLTCRS